MLQGSLYSNSAAGQTYTMDPNSNPILATLPSPGLSSKIDDFQPCSIKVYLKLACFQCVVGYIWVLVSKKRCLSCSCIDSRLQNPDPPVILSQIPHVHPRASKFSYVVSGESLYNSVVVPYYSVPNAPTNSKESYKSRLQTIDFWGGAQIQICEATTIPGCLREVYAAQGKPNMVVYL